VKRTLGSSAMAGRFTAAGFQFIDRAFEQLAWGEEALQEAVMLLPELGEKRSLTASLR
jgi:hypothetical protein